MEYHEFKEIETFATELRTELACKLLESVKKLRYSDENYPRSADTYKSEDAGFAHAISKVEALLTSKIKR